MDPIWMAALTAGAAAGATQVVTDAYTALKLAIRRRFAGDARAAAALDAYEEAPSGVGRVEALARELERTGAAADPALLKLAHSVHNSVVSVYVNAPGASVVNGTNTGDQTYNFGGPSRA